MPEQDLKALETKVDELEKENAYLKSLLEKAGIPYKSVQKVQDDNTIVTDQGSRIVPVNITEKHVNLFYKVCG
ncbi:MAG: hypothetical protein ACI4CS_06565 [Candidatus Weimeria sp.]